MAVLLLLGYAAICAALFKLLHVPVGRWSVTTAVLGGVGIVGVGAWPLAAAMSSLKGSEASVMLYYEIRAAQWIHTSTLREQF